MIYPPTSRSACERKKRSATSVASRAGGIFRQTPPKILPDRARSCQILPDRARSCQASPLNNPPVQSTNPLLKMVAGATKVRTLCSKWQLDCGRAWKKGWNVQSLNPSLTMHAEAPKARTLHSKCKPECPKSEPFA